MGTMGPPESSYDRLISRLGFFNDPPAAFANLRRWLVRWSLRVCGRGPVVRQNHIADPELILWSIAGQDSGC